MKHYHVKVTNKALADMESIYDYIANTLCVPETAGKQYDRIAYAITKLDIMPERCMVMQGDFAVSRELRQLIVDNYSVIYTISGDCVYIVRVLFSASNLEARLKD